MEMKEESFGAWLNRQKDRNNHANGCPIDLDVAAATEIRRLLIEKPSYHEPIREFLDDKETEWRHEKPKYNLTNLAYLKGKTRCHLKDSLEMIVENAVKTWEMEASHKIKTEQWQTVVHDKYSVQANGGKVFGLEEASSRGNYNVLLHNVDKDHYDATSETFESSHQLFINAFGSTFPWEVLDVFVGPPTIVFSWRHWGEFVGEYKSNEGHGELLVMKGFARITVTTDLKVTAIEVFYNPNPFLKSLQGSSKRAEKDGPKNSGFEFVENLIKACEKEKIKKCLFETNGKPVEASTFQYPFKVTEVFSMAPRKISFTWKINDVATSMESERFAIIELDESNSIVSFKSFYKT